MNPQAHERRIRFLSWKELAGLAPLEYLVHNTLLEVGVVLLYGESGCGKTFVVLDMACSIACDMDFLDRETKSGSVVYLAGEGYRGISKRIFAWQKKHQRELPEDKFHLTNDSPALAKPADVDALIAGLRALGSNPRLIVVDTLSTHAPGSDENSAKDMSAFLAGARRLSDEFNCLVIIVHHTGKDGDNYRGSYALKGNTDTLIKVVGMDAIGQPGTIICERQREMEDFEPISFRLEKVYYGAEGDSDRASLVLQEAEPSSPDSLMGREKPLTAEQKLILTTLQSKGPLPRKDLIALTKIPDGSMNSVMNPLKARGLIEKEEGKRGCYKLTEKGLQSIAV